MAFKRIGRLLQYVQMAENNIIDKQAGGHLHKQ